MSKYSIRYIKEDGSIPLSNDWTAGFYLISAGWLAVGSGTSAISGTSGGAMIFDGSNFYGWNGSSLVQLDTSGGAGGVPAIPDRSIQFNNSGSFGGTSALTWSTAGRLGIGVETPVERLDLVDANDVGAIRIGDAIDTVSGTIKWDGNFWGRNDFGWVRLDDTGGSEATAAQLVASEPMGFPNRTDSVLSFDNATRTLHLTAGSAAPTFDYYHKGTKYTTTGGSVQIDDATGTWFFYYIEGTLTAASAAWPGGFSNTCQVAIVYWNALSGYGNLIEERHGLSMDWATHKWAHQTVGTRYNSGLTMSADDTGTGNNNTDAIVSFTGGIVYDEDIEIDIVDSSGSDFFNQVLSPTAQIPITYLSGAGGGSRQGIPAGDFPVYFDGTRIAFNEFVGGEWKLSTVGHTDYMAMWFFASNGVDTPIFAVMGQRQDTSIGNARENNTLETLSFGNTGYQELKVLYRVIYQTRNNYNNDVKARIRHIEDLRSVSNLPAGTYVATDHGALGGLTSDDHPQYVNTDATRPMLSAWDIGQRISASSISATSATLSAGTTINEFSTDGTMADNSDDAVPTEKAVVTFVSAATAGITASGPGGADGNVQYNNGGVLSGESALFWDDTNKRLGIGTTSPIFQLNVRESGAIAVALVETYADSYYHEGAYFIGGRGRNTSASPTAVQSGDYLALFQGMGITGGVGSWGTASQIAIAASENWNAGSQGSHILFQTKSNGTVGAPITRMTIANNGKVGIGTDSPVWDLDVTRDAAGARIAAKCFSNTANYSGVIYLGRGRNIEASPSALNSGDRIGMISFTGHTGTAWKTGSAIISVATETWVHGTDAGSELQFQTTPNDGWGAVTRMVIGNDGKVTLGAGTGINEFSIDGTMAGNSDDAVPTEKAVVTFVQAATAGITGAAPGAPDTSIQFNNGGAFSGSSKMTFNGSSLVLTDSLVCYKEAGPMSMLARSFSDTATHAGTLYVGHARNTYADPDALENDDRIGMVNYIGYDGAGWVNGAFIKGKTTEAWANGTNAGAELIFATTLNGTQALVNRMIIGNDGKVTLGAGTGINEFSTDGTMAGNSDDAVPTEKAVVTFVSAATAGITGAAPGDPDTSIQFNNGGAFSGSSKMTWNGNELRLNSASNIVGYRESGSFGIFARSYSDNDAHSGEIYLAHAKNTEASPGALTSGSRIGIIKFAGHDGANWFNGAYIKTEATETWTDGTDAGCEMVFATTPNNTYNQVQRMVITNTGNIGIGTPTPGDLVSLETSGNATLSIKTTGSGITRFNLARYAGAGDYDMWLIDNRGTFDSPNNRLSIWHLDEGTTDEVFTILPTGNVGIGLPNPQENLQIHSGDSGSNYLKLTNNTTGITGNAGLKIGLDSAEIAYIWNYENTNMYIGTDNTTCLGIDVDGHVSIGTEVPDSNYKLALFNGQMVNIYTGAGNPGMGGASRTTYSSERMIFNFFADAYNDSDVNQSIANILFYQTSNSLGDIRFKTGNIERMRITSAGKVTLGAGTGINEFSTDGTMAGNSDDAVPTEKAVVTYVQAATAGITGVAPGGADTNIQFNYSGAVSGVSNLIYDYTNERVGLGTTTPEYHLHIAKESAGASMAVIGYGTDHRGGISIGHANGSISSPSAVLDTQELGALWFMGYDSASWEYPGGILAVATDDWTAANTPLELQFYTNPNGVAGRVKALTIDENGNLNAPVGNIESHREDGPAYHNIFCYDDSVNVGSFFVGHRAKNTKASPNAIVSGNAIVRLAASGFDSTDYGEAGSIWIKASQNWTDANHGGRIEFYTTPDDSTTALKRMIIDESGFVAVGNHIPLKALHVEGDSGDTSTIVVSRTSNDEHPATMQFKKIRASATVQSGDKIADFTAYGHDGTAYRKSSQIVTICDAVPGTSTTPGRMEFMTSTSGVGISTKFIIDQFGNLAMHSAGSYGGGKGVLFVHDAGTNPGSNPSNGGILYSDSGAGKWRGSGGTVTTFGPAEPHCPDCGRDYILDWENPDKGEHLQVCMWCLVHELGGKSYIKRIKRTLPTPSAIAPVPTASGASGAEIKPELGPIEEFPEKEVNVLDDKTISDLKAQVQELINKVNVLETAAKEAK